MVTSFENLWVSLLVAGKILVHSIFWLCTLFMFSVLEHPTVWACSSLLLCILEHPAVWACTSLMFCMLEHPAVWACFSLIYRIFVHPTVSTISIMADIVVYISGVLFSMTRWVHNFYRETCRCKVMGHYVRFWVLLRFLGSQESRICRNLSSITYGLY
jgi:hypothetical protein